METIDDFSDKKPSLTAMILGNICFTLAILTAIWFGFTSWIWYYGFNLVISYPIGIISLLLWSFGKAYDPDHKRYNYPLKLLVIGLIISIAAFFMFLSNN